MARTTGRKRIQRPDGELRRSQIITTYGPGAMVDLVDHAVIIGGLDFWSYRGEYEKLDEPRLRDAIAERFSALGRELYLEGAFREPPDGDDDEPSQYRGIQVLEFPKWFVCQGCKALFRPTPDERKGKTYVHFCERDKKGVCVPVRFVVACRRGHLDEFPWIWFAHRKGEKCAAPSLKLLEGASGDFAEIQVRCACGQSASLSGFMVEQTAPHCSGERPWLGSEGREECDERQRLLVRTASNSYFAQVVSALSIPETGRELEDAVQANWDVLSAATKETLPAFRQIPKIQPALQAFPDDKVLAAVEARKKGSSPPREPLRSAEYKTLVASEPEQPGLLPDPEDDFFARTAKLDGGLPPGIAQIVLVHKLREVRTLMGFTRIEPVTPDLQGEFDLGVQSQALGLTTRWLPATEVLGEGVFLRLDERAVLEWEDREDVKGRKLALMAGFDLWAKALEKPGKPADEQRRPSFPGVRFYLLHSLAHMLMTAISLECGYSAASIRERIYCSVEKDAPMAGILLSTGSSGTEGTLGGLVEQARRIREHLRRAWDLGGLCSNDPVCASHDPSTDPSERHLEGAACHGCLFVAECSCERYNRYLDRALVVPTIGHPGKLAFFGERP